MRLYSFTSNEKRSSVQKGGNERLTISLHHETEKGSWQCQTMNEEITIDFYWNEGKPELILNLPKSWKQNAEWVNGDFFKFFYCPKE